MNIKMINNIMEAPGMIINMKRINGEINIKKMTAGDLYSL